MIQHRSHDTYMTLRPFGKEPNGWGTAFVRRASNFRLRNHSALREATGRWPARNKSFTTALLHCGG